MGAYAGMIVIEMQEAMVSSPTKKGTERGATQNTQLRNDVGRRDGPLREDHFICTARNEVVKHIGKPDQTRSAH